MQQQQFLNVIDRDVAERLFHDAIDLAPLPEETIPLTDALHRVLARDVIAPVDVPNFDRSNMDGFAVRAADTFGATEDHAVALLLNSETISAGSRPQESVAQGSASAIATGAMIPRGADAVVMMEHTESEKGHLIVRRAVAPGANITFAGADIGCGETVLFRGELLTSRENGIVAALGLAEVTVVRRPRVAIVSTGDELVRPGESIEPGQIYDSNGVILADAVRELGGEPVVKDIVPDEKHILRETLEAALENDVVLLSGGTSKGEGDISYRMVTELGSPGIIAHGIALKPGKPLCLAAIVRDDRTIPVVILPGFPTSAIFTFHEFVAPIIRSLAGRRYDAPAVTKARLPLRVNSERGRTEYMLVGLVGDSTPAAPQQPGCSHEPAYTAWPMGKGSGSVTTFSRADGFLVIPRQQEYLDAETSVAVHLLDRQIRPADLVVIGSHCIGLDYLLSVLRGRGYSCKVLSVGSTAGLEAAKRGECDLAGIHLLDEKSNEYNKPFVSNNLTLFSGYGRRQGVVYRKDDSRFAVSDYDSALQTALADPDCIMVNRNGGSGTRILIDRVLAPHMKEPPPGYFTEAKSHNAVVAAVAQNRADWGVAIETAAKQQDLGFLPIRDERYDFIAPSQRLDRPAVEVFRNLLIEKAIRSHLQGMGFKVS